jgi:hypothetical protein
LRMCARLARRPVHRGFSPGTVIPVVPSQLLLTLAGSRIHHQVTGST